LLYTTTVGTVASQWRVESRLQFPTLGTRARLAGAKLSLFRTLTYLNYELFNHMTFLRNNPRYILKAYSLFNKNAHKMFLYHK